MGPQTGPDENVRRPTSLPAPSPPASAACRGLVGAMFALVVLATGCTDIQGPIKGDTASGTPGDDPHDTGDGPPRDLSIRDFDVGAICGGAVPVARQHAQSAAFVLDQPVAIGGGDRQTDRGILMLGGTDAAQGVLVDTWVFDLTTLDVVPDGGDTGASADLSFSACPWILVDTSSEAAARFGGALGFVQDGAGPGSFVLVGGIERAGSQLSTSEDVFRADAAALLSGGAWTSAGTVAAADERPAVVSRFVGAPDCAGSVPWAFYDPYCLSSGSCAGCQLCAGEHPICEQWDHYTEDVASCPPWPVPYQTDLLEPPAPACEDDPICSSSPCDALSNCDVASDQSWEVTLRSTGVAFAASAADPSQGAVVGLGGVSGCVGDDVGCASRRDLLPFGVESQLPTDAPLHVRPGTAFTVSSTGSVESSPVPGGLPFGAAGVLTNVHFDPSTRRYIAEGGPMLAVGGSHFQAIPSQWQGVLDGSWEPRTMTDRTTGEVRTVFSCTGAEAFHGDHAWTPEPPSPGNVLAQAEDPALLVVGAGTAARPATQLPGNVFSAAAYLGMSTTAVVVGRTDQGSAGDVYLLRVDALGTASASKLRKTVSGAPIGASLNVDPFQRVGILFGGRFDRPTESRITVLDGWRSRPLPWTSFGAPSVETTAVITLDAHGEGQVDLDGALEVTADATTNYIDVWVMYQSPNARKLFDAANHVNRFQVRVKSGGTGTEFWHGAPSAQKLETFGTAQRWRLRLPYTVTAAQTVRVELDLGKLPEITTGFATDLLIGSTAHEAMRVKLTAAGDEYALSLPLLFGLAAPDEIPDQSKWGYKAKMNVTAPPGWGVMGFGAPASTFESDGATAMTFGADLWYREDAVLVVASPYLEHVDTVAVQAPGYTHKIHAFAQSSLLAQHDTAPNDSIRSFLSATGERTLEWTLQQELARLGPAYEENTWMLVSRNRSVPETSGWHMYNGNIAVVPYDFATGDRSDTLTLPLVTAHEVAHTWFSSIFYPSDTTRNQHSDWFVEGGAELVARSLYPIETAHYTPAGDVAVAERRSDANDGCELTRTPNLEGDQYSLATNLVRNLLLAKAGATNHPASDVWAPIRPVSVLSPAVLFQVLLPHRPGNFVEDFQCNPATLRVRGIRTTTEGSWLEVEQVQDEIHARSLVKDVPFFLACPTAADPTGPNAFGACNATNTTDPTLLASIGASEGLTLGIPLLTTGKITLVPLGKPGAAGFPLETHLITGPSMEVGHAALASNRLVWCGGTTADSACVDDADGDHTPDATDCWDEGDDDAHHLSAKDVYPSLAFSTGSVTLPTSESVDMDCNCIASQVPASPTWDPREHEADPHCLSWVGTFREASDLDPYRSY